MLSRSGYGQYLRPSQIKRLPSSLTSLGQDYQFTSQERLSRCIDVFLCSVALVLLAPLMLFVAAVVYMQDGGPVIFKHRRVGRGGRSFYCLKFRTMAVNAEQRLKDLLASCPAKRKEWELEHKLHDDPRITPLGNFLRKTSLDELPQLFNVLRGDMSMVGPRPIVESEVRRYGTRFKYYVAVRPGITGLWQVSGRNDVSYRTRVAMDVTYVRTRNIKLDLWILVSTVRAVLLQQGSY